MTPGGYFLLCKQVFLIREDDAQKQISEFLGILTMTMIWKRAPGIAREMSSQGKLHW